MEQYFLNVLGLDWKMDKGRLLCRKNRWPWRGPPRLAHLTAQEYLQYGYLTREEFDQMFKFAFVRNPWARLVSEYKYAHHDQNINFESWVMEHFPTARDESWPRRSDAYRHVMPQTDFLLDDQGELLLDFVGRFENIAEDFPRACELAGVQSGCPKPRNVGGKRGHYSDFYTPKLQQRVAEMYAPEIEMFGYSYEG